LSIFCAQSDPGKRTKMVSQSSFIMVVLTKV
jgi:hypothetical protein